MGHMISSISVVVANPQYHGTSIDRLRWQVYADYLVVEPRPGPIDGTMINRSYSGPNR